MNDKIPYCVSDLQKPKMFRLLVEQYKAYVFAVILRYVPDHHMAEDIAQETFIKAHSKLREYRGGDIKIWLGRIAANLAIDYLRARKQSYEYKDEVVNIKVSSNMEERLIDCETYKKLNDEIQALDEKYRDIITLYYYERKSYKEIAEMMNIPEKTVETRLYRGRKLLRKEMEDEI